MADTQPTDTSCGRCGTQNRAGADFCRHCGSSLKCASSRSSRAGGIKRLLMMFINPGALIRNHLADYSWPWALGVSGLAFMLFFLQTGMDLVRVKKLGAAGAVWLTVNGIAYGTVGVALLAGVAWLGCRSVGTGHSYVWTVRAFGLGYCPTLVYVVIGLFANLLFGWNTSVAFGVTGTLWAMSPMNAAIKEMTAGKTGYSIALTCLCGGLLLFGWAFVGTR